MSRSPITTHVLDTTRGCPAAGVEISLERRNDDGSFTEIARGRTNADGRITDLLAPGSAQPGIYRMIFQTDAYFSSQSGTGFYPWVPVIFRITDPSQHHHIPLLLSPYGFSTYRGS